MSDTAALQPLLPRYLRAIRSFVSTDASRPILGAVHLGADHVVATDSYRLVRIDYRPGDPSSFPLIAGRRPVHGPISANIDGRAFVDAVNSIPTARRPKALPVLSNAAIIEDGAHEVSIGTTDLNRAQVFVARKVQGQFPCYDEVLNLGTPPRAAVAINARMLQETARAVREFGADHLVMEVRSPLKPVIFRAGNATGGALTAVVMPVRPAEDLDVPGLPVDLAIRHLKTALALQREGVGRPGAAQRNAAVKSARADLDAVLLEATL